MPSPQPVHSLLLPRSGALLADLPAARIGDPGAVHRTRVASRRLREVLATVRRLHPGKIADRARREVRRVTRALGPVRELDVSLDLFETLVAAHQVDAAAQLAVRRALTVARAAALRSARVKLPAARSVRLRRALEALVAAVATAEGHAVVAEAVETRVAQRAAGVQQALDLMGTVYVPARLHAVRIAVKQLRYALEVSGDATPANVATRLRELKSVQELLGRAHDLHVLEERLQDVQAQVVRTSRPTAREVRRLARAIDASCRQLHGAFMSRRAALATLAARLATPVPARLVSSAS